MSNKKPFKPTSCRPKITIGSEPNLVYFIIVVPDTTNPYVEPPHDIDREFVFPFSVVPSENDTIMIGDDVYRVLFNNLHRKHHQAQYGIFSREDGTLASLPIRYLSLISDGQ